MISIWEQVREKLNRFRSIQTTVILSFSSLVMLSIALFLVISLKYTENAIVHNSADYTIQLVKQLNSEMDSYIEYMKNISKMVSNNNSVREYLFSEWRNEGSADASYRDVVEQFRTVMSTRDDISNIGVVANNGRNVINRGYSRLNPYVPIETADWYEKAKETKGEVVLSTSHVQNVIADDYSWVVTLARGIENPNTGQIEGVFFIDLNYQSINDLCQNISLGKRGYIFAMDKKGKIIYHPQQQLLYTGLKKEIIKPVLDSKKNSFQYGTGKDAKLFTRFQSKQTGWTVVGVSYMEELMKERKQVQFTYFAVAFLLLTAAILTAIVISREITKPIKELDLAMKEIGKGHFDNIAVEVKTKNEIGRLSKMFNIMTEQIRELIEQNNREQREKRKAEMKVLQSQINPHFLYNTLDSIIWMSESEKNKEVVLMTSSLAALLRQSISNNDELFTIEQEIEYTTKYLTIQKMRYEDKLEYNVEVDENILKEKIVKIILQPLVENAIYHGLKYMEGKGMIWIRGYKAAGKIFLEVSDNGVGMTEEELAHVFDKRKRERKSNGVGVYNVQNRLQLYYGMDYGLSYESEEGHGTTATVTIPQEEVQNDSE